MGPALPGDVADSVTARWPVTGPAWVSDITDELDSLCRRYDAVPLRTLPSRWSFVVEAEDANGALLILRASPDPHVGFQTAVVQALAGIGAGPYLYEIIGTATGSWTVSERVTPGASLFEVEAPPPAIARALRTMCGHRVPAPEMPCLFDWLRDRLTDGSLTDIPPGQTPAPLEQRERASELLETLAESSIPGLCHGDASPGNLLTSDDRGILLIDPRGLQGEVAYDVAVAAMKTATDTTHLARLVGIDPDRVGAWMNVADAARV